MPSSGWGPGEQVDGAHDTKQELAQSDCEVDQWDEFAGGDAVNDDEGPDDQDITADQNGDRDFLVDLWPFARPIRDFVHYPSCCFLLKRRSVSTNITISVYPRIAKGFNYP